MTEPTTPRPPGVDPAYRPAPRPSGGRIASLVAGGVAALVALGLIVLGGAALYGNAQKDDDGYLSTGGDPYSTSTYAVATENLDIDGEDVAGVVDEGLYGKVRLKVDARDDKPVFVGIARSSDVSRYLDGIAHARVTDVDYSPFHADYRTHGGNHAPAAPAEQGFWATSTHGPGEQTLTWDVEDGDWSVVVMNADGSRGVDANVTAGANVPILGPLGWASLGTGAFLLLAAGGLVLLGVRTPRTGPGRPLGISPAPAAA